MAPRTLPQDKHPHFNSEFRPIELTADLRALSVVQEMLGLQEDGHIEWQLGRKGTHIASHFTTSNGDVDTLTSPNPSDEDYESLTCAHIQRAVDVVFGGWGERGGGRGASGPTGSLDV